MFTSAELSDLSCGPGRGPEHNNLGWHSLYLGGKRCNPRVPGLSCLAARENVPGKSPREFSSLADREKVPPRPPGENSPGTGLGTNTYTNTTGAGSRQCT